VSLYQDSDVKWMEYLVSCITDTGVWCCPCTQSIFKFDKPRKEYELVGDITDPTNIISMSILEKELGYTRKE
jgi:hypothetical protein